MKKYIIALAILINTSLFGQSNSSTWFLLGFSNSTFDDIAERVPSNYAFLVDINGKYIVDRNGNYIIAPKESLYSFNFNNSFQFYVRKKQNEILLDDSRLLACILQSKRSRYN